MWSPWKSVIATLTYNGHYRLASHETWLWLVTQSGTLRFAPEKQVHRSKLLSLRQNIICHGDLAMPTDDSIGIRRSPAVFGGEVRDTLALNVHPFASSFMYLCLLIFIFS